MRAGPIISASPVGIIAITVSRVPASSTAHRSTLRSANLNKRERLAVVRHRRGVYLHEHSEPLKKPIIPLAVAASVSIVLASQAFPAPIVARDCSEASQDIGAGDGAVWASEGWSHESTSVCPAAAAHKGSPQASVTSGSAYRTRGRSSELIPSPTRWSQGSSSPAQCRPVAGSTSRGPRSGSPIAAKGTTSPALTPPRTRSPRSSTSGAKLGE